MLTEGADFQPAHCRSARALLGWTQAELATAAAVGRMTVKRFESGDTLRPAQANAIRAALEQAGILLVGEGATWLGRAVRVGVAMVSGREPSGWTAGQPVPDAADERDAAEEG